MSWISDGLAALGGLPAPVLLLVAFAASFAESGLGVGMLLPGETAVLILGASARDAVMLIGLFLVVTIGCCAGDHVGYLLGRRYGKRLRETRLVGKLGVEHWDRAVAALHKHGALAIVLTRLLPVVRTLTPATAGVAGLRYPKFLFASLLAGLLWSAVYVFAGAAAGASIHAVERFIGQAGWIVFAVLAVLVLGVLLWRKRRKRATESEAVTASERD